MKHFLDVGKKIDSLEKRLYVARWWDNDIIGGGNVNVPILSSRSIHENLEINVVRLGYGSIEKEKYDPYFRKTTYLPVQYPEDLERIPKPNLQVLETKIVDLSQEVKILKEKGYFRNDRSFTLGLANSLFWVHN